MNENEKWSFHVEYLKLAIALATAVIAAAAAIYVDSSKIPTDTTRYFLLFGVGAFFLMLISSVWSLALLATHLVKAGEATDSVTRTAKNTNQPTADSLATISNHPTGTKQTGDSNSTAAAVTERNTEEASQETKSRFANGAAFLANVSFFLLIVGAAFLGLFFLTRTLAVSSLGADFPRAVATATIANQALIDTSKGESTNLRTVELKTDGYELVFQISPGGGTTTVVTAGGGAILKSAKRQ